MSQIQVDTIYNLNADGPPTLEGGAIVSGIATASIFKGDVNADVMLLMQHGYRMN